MPNLDLNWKNINIVYFVPSWFRQASFRVNVRDFFGMFQVFVSWFNFWTTKMQKKIMKYLKHNSTRRISSIVFLVFVKAKAIRNVMKISRAPSETIFYFRIITVFITWTYSFPISLPWFRSTSVSWLKVSAYYSIHFIWIIFLLDRQRKITIKADTGQSSTIKIITYIHTYDAYLCRSMNGHFYKR